jgi:hypothetical protein
VETWKRTPMAAHLRWKMRKSRKSRTRLVRGIFEATTLCLRLSSSFLRNR